MLIHSEILTPVIIGKRDSSDNTTDLLGGILGQVLVKPPSDDAIYDVKITNDNSIVIFDRESEEGTLSEIVDCPIRGIYTVEIRNPTKNGTYTIQLIIRNQ